jgi:hypothetical protein
MTVHPHAAGTRNYLWWALGLLAYGLYCVWDGWFPRAAVVERHPDPGDSFYLFNQVVAVICLVGSAVCAYIHKVVK